jgi:hypothetical protein
MTCLKCIRDHIIRRIGWFLTNSAMKNEYRPGIRALAHVPLPRVTGQQELGSQVFLERDPVQMIDQIRQL